MNKYDDNKNMNQWSHLVTLSSLLSIIVRNHPKDRSNVTIKTNIWNKSFISKKVII